MEETCPKCGSKKWMTGLEVTGEDRLFSRVTPLNYKDRKRGLIEINRLSVCADCRHVEFQATLPPNVWEDWQSRNQ